MVTASAPPARTIRHSSLACAAMSSTKKIPNTHTTASKRPSGYPSARMSATRNVTFSSPARHALPRALASSSPAMSTPITAPPGPTAPAAGSADAPLPHGTSRTLAPGPSSSRSIVCAPSRAQKPSDGSS